MISLIPGAQAAAPDPRAVRFTEIERGTRHDEEKGNRRCEQI
jgi:hypothetical protein